MLQVNTGQQKKFTIKSIRTTDNAENTPHGSVCSFEAGDGSDKPPC